MLKPQLIDSIAETAGISKQEAGAALTAFTDQITDQLSIGDNIAIAGLGSFSVKHSEARQSRNPQTGEAMTINARERVVFRPAKRLKEAVNPSASN